MGCSYDYLDLDGSQFFFVLFSWFSKLTHAGRNINIFDVPIPCMKF